MAFVNESGATRKSTGVVDGGTEEFAVRLGTANIALAVAGGASGGIKSKRLPKMRRAWRRQRQHSHRDCQPGSGQPRGLALSHFPRNSRGAAPPNFSAVCPRNLLSGVPRGVGKKHWLLFVSHFDFAPPSSKQA